MVSADVGLPPGVEDVVLNRAQLASALNKSEPTITAWLREGLPFISAGTNGKSYEFQLSDCWRWVQGKEAEAEARRTSADAAVMQMRLALVGGSELDAHEASLSPKARRELYDAEQAFMTTALQRQALVKRPEVVSMLEDVLLTVRDAVTALPDRLEREAGLTGKPLDLAITICDQVLAEAQKRIEQQATGAAYRDAAE